MADAVLKKGPAAAGAELGAEGGGRGAFGDQALQAAESTDLHDGGASEIAAAAAVGTIRRRRHGDKIGRAFAVQPRGEACGEKIPLWMGPSAARAGSPHQALGDHAFQRRGEHQRIQSDVAQPGDGAQGVVGVQGAEAEPPGERRAQADLGRGPVAGFTDQDDVRVVAEHVPEQFLERAADPLLDIDLEKVARMTDLDRLLQGDDLELIDAGRRQVVQHRVQQRGLACAGGPGDVDQPMGRLEQIPQLDLVGRPEAHVGERAQPVLVVDDADDDRFAVDCGQGREAQMIGARADGDRALAVLRQAPLGDVHAAREFRRLDHRFAQAFLDEAPVDEAAVDPLAHVEAVLAWLEVQIRRPLGHGLAEEAGENLVGAARGRLPPGVLEQGKDLAARRHFEPHLVMGKITPGLRGAVRRRILDGDPQFALGLPEWQDPFLARRFEREQAGDGAIGRRAAETRQRQAVAAGREFGELVGAGQAQELEGAGETAPRILAPELLRAGELLGADRSGLDERLAEPKGAARGIGVLHGSARPLQRTVSAVRKITSSLRVRVPPRVPNARPSTGMSPRPGTWRDSELV